MVDVLLVVGMVLVTVGIKLLVEVEVEVEVEFDTMEKSLILNPAPELLI